jgi:hypothetical protein
LLAMLDSSYVEYETAEPKGEGKRLLAAGREG